MTIFDGSNPTSTWTSPMKLRISRPAPSSSTSESATSPTTRPLRTHPWLVPVPLPDSFSPCTRSRRAPCHAGSRPKRKAVTTAVARLKSRAELSSLSSTS